MVKHIYTDDLKIAQTIINREEQVTRKYFYQQCYPLFKSIYDNYYTDCDCCKEFIDEIYILILSPNRTTGKCQLENYRGESTLTSWLKTVALYYCYRQFGLKGGKHKYEPILFSHDKEIDEGCDRNEAIYGSIDLDISILNNEDVSKIIALMPNERYRELIRLRYIESMTHEETAKKLCMTMSNYYNKHKLAREQYIRIWKKETRHG